MNTINDGGPERIWIESEGECPYYYHEEELSDVAPPITEYVRADKLRAEIEALRAEVEVWKASFEQAAAGHATYAERTEQLAKVLRLAEEHINAIPADWYNAGQQVLVTIRDALSKEEWHE